MIRCCSSPRAIARSELIHLGQSVGVAQAEHYYCDWFPPGLAGDPARAWPAFKDSLPGGTAGAGRGAGTRWSETAAPRPHPICAWASSWGPAACWWPTIERGGRVCPESSAPWPWGPPFFFAAR